MPMAPPFSTMVKEGLPRGSWDATSTQPCTTKLGDGLMTIHLHAHPLPYSRCQTLIDVGFHYEEAAKESEVSASGSSGSSTVSDTDELSSGSAAAVDNDDDASYVSDTDSGYNGYDGPYPDALDTEIDENRSEFGRRIGHLDATLVSKKSRGGRKPWVDELLLLGDDCFTDAMCAFYDFDGKMKKAFRARGTELAANQMVFIDILFLRPEFRDVGFGSLALEMFHDMLLEMDNGCAFRGTVLLTPGVIEGVVHEDDEVEDAFWRRLVGFYEKNGYRTWFEEGKGRVASYRIMGRTI